MSHIICNVKLMYLISETKHMQLKLFLCLKQTILDNSKKKNYNYINPLIMQIYNYIILFSFIFFWVNLKYQPFLNSKKTYIVFKGTKINK